MVASSPPTAPAMAVMALVGIAILPLTATTASTGHWLLPLPLPLPLLDHCILCHKHAVASKIAAALLGLACFHPLLVQHGLPNTAMRG